MIKKKYITSYPYKTGSTSITTELELYDKLELLDKIFQ